MILLIFIQNLTTITAVVLEIISPIKIDTDDRQRDRNEEPLFSFSRGLEMSRKH